KEAKRQRGKEAKRQRGKEAKRQRGKEAKLFHNNLMTNKLAIFFYFFASALLRKITHSQFIVSTVRRILKLSISDIGCGISEVNLLYFVKNRGILLYFRNQKSQIRNY
ncbi:hypothetical protein, partial [Cellulophaga sp. BC115SP]|uniref:hypothetical protein n=1 Tax=Cellulophaga sp. BC115SP TaxID=2683263 RepID=UPI00196B9198